MLKIYGQSDDLIEFRGDIHDEMGSYSDEDRYLAFSDGTLLKVNYGVDGAYWRFQVLTKGRDAVVRHTPAGSGGEDYSDIVEIEHPSTFYCMQWIVISDRIIIK